VEVTGLVVAGAAWWVVDGQGSTPKAGMSKPLRVGIAPGFFVLEKVLP
jgi:hypothetical protein